MSLRDFFRKSADRSDARAKQLGIDPPRPGRKTYAERYAETDRMSTSDLLELRSRRLAAGKEIGVIDRVLSDRDDIDENKARGAGGPHQRGHRGLSLNLDTN